MRACCRAAAWNATVGGRTIRAGNAAFLAEHGIVQTESLQEEADRLGATAVLVADGDSTGRRHPAARPHPRRHPRSRRRASADGDHPPGDAHRRPPARRRCRWPARSAFTMSRRNCCPSRSWTAFGNSLRRAARWPWWAMASTTRRRWPRPAWESRSPAPAISPRKPPMWSTCRIRSTSCRACSSQPAAMQTAWQNIVLFAGALNLLAVLACATGKLGPIGAAITHQLSSFCVMMNSLRLLRVEPAPGAGARARVARMFAGSPLPALWDSLRGIRNFGKFPMGDRPAKPACEARFGRRRQPDRAQRLLCPAAGRGRRHRALRQKGYPVQHAGPALQAALAGGTAHAHPGAQGARGRDRLPVQRQHVGRGARGLRVERAAPRRALPEPAGRIADAHRRSEHDRAQRHRALRSGTSGRVPVPPDRWRHHHPRGSRIGDPRNHLDYAIGRCADYRPPGHRSESPRGTAAAHGSLRSRYPRAAGEAGRRASVARSGGRLSRRLGGIRREEPPDQ